MLTNKEMLDATTFLAGVNATLDSAKKQESHIEATAKGVQSNVAELRKASAELDNELSGFNRPRFLALTGIGMQFHDTYIAGTNGAPSKAAEYAVNSAAACYVQTFTARGEKSEKGGGTAGYKTIIRIGNAAERVRAALAKRHAYYMAMGGERKGEAANEKETRMATHYRFTEICRRGDKPKHNGAEGRIVNGITVGELGKRRGGAPREAQFSLLARFYEEFGENALHNDVVDAVLDNGGRLDKPAGIVVAATKAAELILELLDVHQGRMSADAAELTMLGGVLGRIIEQGKFTDVTPATVPVPAPNAPAPTTLPTPPAPVATPAPVVESAPAETPAAPLAAGEISLAELLESDPASLTGTTAPASVAPANKPRGRGRGSLAA